MKKNRFLHILVTVLIWLFIALGTALAAWMFADVLPLLGQEVNGAYYMTIAAVLGLLCYAGALFIAILLLQMLRSLKADPFVTENVRRLRLMGFTALGITACTFLLLLIPVNVFIFLAAGMAVGLCGLLALVLAEVFDRAVAYKCENDLTV